jgi:hypothetical protein
MELGWRASTAEFKRLAPVETLSAEAAAATCSRNHCSQRVTSIAPRLILFTGV